ncbi:FMN-binding negative transcriptional regulator [Gemmatimonas aurantiaca]|uniref:FMN-binding negative transcriptional regulator n=1 Tax=Gemmatimonas aurantiaca TaxID=173480 RepID=UPI00301DC25D
MYIPASFRESDRAVLFDFLEAHALGALISGAPGGETALYATHLPLWLDRERGVLEGHLALANPHAKHLTQLDAGAQVLVIFTGPDAYISPGWYPGKHEHGKAVPTWNYIAVHVHGTFRMRDDREFLMTHLERLTTVHEATQSPSWTMAEAPAAYIEQMARAIVGIEISIDVLEGKFKMSQNRSDADIDGVVRGLSASPDATAHEVAAHVAARKPVR